MPPELGPERHEKGPVRPALSRQVPLRPASVMSASRWTGAAPGVVTIVSAIPIVPLGLRNAEPITDAAVALPHWSSVPSRR